VREEAEVGKQHGKAVERKGRTRFSDFGEKVLRTVLQLRATAAPLGETGRGGNEGQVGSKKKAAVLTCARASRLLSLLPPNKS
jgi:hypothetical protein